LHFPSLSPTDKTRFKRPFTRSLSHKEVVEAEVIPKASVPKKVKSKSDIIGKPIEVMEKAFVQKKDKRKGESTENPVEIININSPPETPTFKRLIRQLRDARKKLSV